MQPPIREKLLDFYRLAYERQSIWQKREAGAQPPWTDDQTLSGWRFTNVFRELDPGTVELVRTMDAAAAEGLPGQDRVFNLWFYRELNSRRSWREITGGAFLPLNEGSLAVLSMRMEDRHKGGLSVFTTAHTTPSLKGMVEAMPIVAKAAGPLAKRLAQMGDLKDVFEHMRCLPATGNFIAYQMAQDLTYGTDPLTPASLDEWALPGPGVLSGLEVLFGRRVTPGEAVHCMAQLRDLQDEAFEELRLDFQSVAHRDHVRLTISAVEHWTCEYLKYHRIAYEGGAGRHRYVAP